MDAITMIKERRSVRKFKDEVVDRKLMEEIVEIARFSPSWGNYQVARYTFVDNGDIIKRLAHEGVNNFIYNIELLKNAKGVAVLSFVKGKSGIVEKLPLEDGEFNYDGNSNHWEVFDAGLSCQTFCLAAHAKGIGTTIMGIINDKIISEIVGLPEEETVAALIVYGYPDEKPATTPRKETSEIMRFVGE
jgi:nitroreductase